LDYILHWIWGTLNQFVKIINCKNVRIKKFQHAGAIQKKREYNGKLPLISYHVIEVKSTFGSSSTTAQGLWSNRVHLCRGHMREYTAEAPLFGNPKLVGRFWCPPHARGNKRQGIVIKDYELETA
jgi:hypothetical protein